MQVERYLPIPGYEGRYEVSDHGNVKAIAPVSKSPYYTPKPRSGILKHDVLKKGYRQVTLYLLGIPKRFKVHRLVASVFIDNPKGLPQVNHIDSNPNNNHYLNLEWCTPKENMQHSIGKGRKRVCYGESNGMCKVSNEDVSKIIALRKEGLRLHIIGERFGISFQHVSRIVHGVRRSRNIPAFTKRKLEKVL